jgi:hypothetical protein
VEGGLWDNKQLGHAFLSQEAHFIRDLFLHFAISKAPAIMTVSVPSSLTEPGLVPAACQYMENVFAAGVKRNGHIFKQAIHRVLEIKGTSTALSL